MTTTSAALALCGLLLGVVVGYAACFMASSRPVIVRTPSPFELQFSPKERCVLPPGTTLEYDRTLESEGISTYILYLNIKDGTLPKPGKATNRWYRNPVLAYPLGQ